MMWGYPGNEFGFGGMFLGMTMMLLFWILLIAVIVLAVRFLWRHDVSQNRRIEDTALEVLKKRYANGEIDRDTFERMKKDIE